MLKHMLSFRVEPENETILVEQVLEESPVVAGFDNCGTNPEPEIVIEGKPRFMHYTITLFTLKSLSLMLLIALSCLFKCYLLNALPTLLIVYHP